MTKSKCINCNAKLFPLQTENVKKYKLPQLTSVPWAIAEIAYYNYRATHGWGQSLYSIAERGGFGQSEMDTYYPKWREACSATLEIETKLHLVSEEHAAMKRTLANVVACCECEGTGFYMDDYCRFCGDSTYDHKCDDPVKKSCIQTWCKLARLSLSEIK